MKKRTIIALIVAAALIVIGGILVVLGLSFTGTAEQSALTQQDILISEVFENLVIDTEDCDVEFAMLSGGADTRITIFEQAGVAHSVSVGDGTLTIKMMDERKWTDHISVYPVYGQWESMKMIVYLPEAEYASLQVRTDTGDISVAELPVFREMMLRTTTGDITCTGVSGDVLDCMVTTGHITLQSGTPNQVKLHAGTGDLNVTTTACDEIHLKTDTGNVNAKTVKALTFTSTVNTGDIKLEGIQAQTYLQAFADTGDITIRNSDAPEVNIETDTGDVIVPAAWEFQRIETDTGKIKYE